VSIRTNSATVWDQRIARARELALEQASAREALTFYANLAEYQRALFLTARSVRGAADFAGAVDVAAASAAVPDFLVWLERNAPGPLALMAGRLRDEGAGWHGLMREYLEREDPVDASEGEERSVAEPGAFVTEAVLQPFAEATAIDRREHIGPSPNTSGRLASRCPVCSRPPCLGILREEGQGARRTLLCGCCVTEWEYLRVVCPKCLEERFDALPVYTADTFPHVRIDACDTCRRYLKTIDLTKNGLAVPLVDDIASLPLDLWAGEKGYRRLRANLLRTSDPSPRQSKTLKSET
jgi:formate dehydrogenase maturation protein FdhE